MVAVRREDAVGLARRASASIGLPTPSAGRLVGPRGALDLEVEAQLVGRRERRLGRTPGVEADQVEAVGLRDADDALPARDVRRRMAGQREDRALERAAEEGLAAVDRELGAARCRSRAGRNSRTRPPDRFAVERRGQRDRARENSSQRARRRRARSPRRTSPPAPSTTPRPTRCPGPRASLADDRERQHAHPPGRPVALPIRPVTDADRVAT